MKALLSVGELRRAFKETKQSKFHRFVLSVNGAIDFYTVGEPKTDRWQDSRLELKSATVAHRSGIQRVIEGVVEMEKDAYAIAEKLSRLLDEDQEIMIRYDPNAPQDTPEYNRLEIFAPSGTYRVKARLSTVPVLPEQGEVKQPELETETPVQYEREIVIPTAVLKGITKRGMDSLTVISNSTGVHIRVEGESFIGISLPPQQAKFYIKNIDIKYKIRPVMKGTEIRFGIMESQIEIETEEKRGGSSMPKRGSTSVVMTRFIMVNGTIFPESKKITLAKTPEHPKRRSRKVNRRILRDKKADERKRIEAFTELQAVLKRRPTPELCKYPHYVYDYRQAATYTEAAEREGISLHGIREIIRLAYAHKDKKSWSISGRYCDYIRWVKQLGKPEPTLNGGNVVSATEIIRVITENVRIYTKGDQP